MKRRYTIYLAGPITGCNHQQQVVWRQYVRREWGSQFDFIDPTDPVRLPGDDCTIHDIVSTDEQRIASADAVLASMWKESIGTAIGVVLARRAGKPVVIVDRNHINSNILGYWSDASDVSEDGAMEKLSFILEAQEKLTTVQKSGSDAPPQSFRREKLATSIRRACADADKNDILVTADIVPQVIRKLCDGASGDGKAIETKTIANAIHQTLEELEKVRPEKFEGIREAWLQHKADIEKWEKEAESLRQEISSLKQEMEEFNNDAMLADKGREEAENLLARQQDKLRQKEAALQQTQQALDQKKDAYAQPLSTGGVDDADALCKLFPDFEFIREGLRFIRSGEISNLRALTDVLVKIRQNTVESKRFKGTDNWLEVRVNFGRGTQVGRLYFRKHPTENNAYMVLLSPDHDRQDNADKGLMQARD